MPNYQRHIIYLSEAQKAELFTNGSITVNGQTITYSDNDLYITPQEEPVTDVQVNGSSVVSSGVANVPIAASGTWGVTQPQTDRGIGTTNGKISISPATDTHIKNGNMTYFPVCTAKQHASTFYGLAKAAGADMKDIASTTVGTYPDTQKAAIQTMLGITDLISTEETSTATAAHALNSTFMMNGKLHRATAAIAIGDAVEVGTNCEVVKADEVFVKNTDYATSSAAGIVKVNSIYGIGINSNNVLTISPASDSQVKTGTEGNLPIGPSRQHMATFYGLAKAAGDTTQSQSNNAVGTYTADAKAAIQTMLGVPGDVQIDGTSIVSNGVANIPFANSSTLGVVKIGAGIYTGSTGTLYTDPATSANIKAATHQYKPITPYMQHESVFYGLAKAAGDTTQASSSNAVGTYTTAAQTAIQTMLGVQNGVSFIETVTGTTPSITGVANTRYVCGEVSTISITPPVAGSIIVRFTSGSTAATLTVPNTVKFPLWFDATSLEEDTIYEIMITDGVYGGVMTWAD